MKEKAFNYIKILQYKNTFTYDERQYNTIPHNTIKKKHAFFYNQSRSHLSAHLKILIF